MAAVSKNRHYHWAEIQPRHWASTAAACGYAPEEMQRLVDEVMAGIEPAVAKVEADLPTGFPEQVATPIFQGVRQAARKFQP